MNFSLLSFLQELFTRGATHVGGTMSSSTGTSCSSQSQSVPSSASIDFASTVPPLPTQDIVDGISDDEDMRVSAPIKKEHCINSTFVNHNLYQ